MFVTSYKGSNVFLKSISDLFLFHLFTFSKPVTLLILLEMEHN